MQQHLQRLDGVAKAEVSLRDGRVVVLPKKDAGLDPQAILKATYDSGVSVAEMDITAAGELQPAGTGLAFRISARQIYAVSPSALADQLRAQTPPGRKARVRARLYQKPAGAAKQKDPPQLSRMEVLEILGGAE